MHLYTNLAPRQLIMQIVYAFAYQFGPVTIMQIVYAFVYQFGPMAVNHGDRVCICIPVWPYGS